MVSHEKSSSFSGRAIRSKFHGRVTTSKTLQPSRSSRRISSSIGDPHSQKESRLAAVILLSRERYKTGSGYPLPQRRSCSVTRVRGGYLERSKRVIAFSS